MKKYVCNICKKTLPEEAFYHYRKCGLLYRRKECKACYLHKYYYIRHKRKKGREKLLLEGFWDIYKIGTQQEIKQAIDFLKKCGITYLKNHKYGVIIDSIL